MIAAWRGTSHIGSHVGSHFGTGKERGDEGHPHE
jgi:hypothetical protein